MKNNALKRNILKISIGILSVLFISATFLFIRNYNTSPSSLINQKYSGTKFEAQDEISQIESIQDKNIILYFYYNNSSQITCAVLKKNFWGYEILCLSGQLPPNDDSQTERRMSTAINRGKNGSIYWGILYDHSISRVLIENHDANVISAKDIKFWCYLSESSIDIHNAVFIR